MTWSLASRRMRRLDLCSFRWRAFACSRMTLPLPVIRKRFFAPLCVLFFGTCVLTSFRSPGGDDGGDVRAGRNGREDSASAPGGAFELRVAGRGDGLVVPDAGRLALVLDFAAVGLGAAGRGVGFGAVFGFGAASGSGAASTLAAATLGAAFGAAALGAAALGTVAFAAGVFGAGAACGATGSGRAGSGATVSTTTSGAAASTAGSGVADAGAAFGVFGAFGAFGAVAAGAASAGAAGAASAVAAGAASAGAAGAASGRRFGWLRTSDFFLVGPRTMIMLRPSCRGLLSTKPSSATSSANRWSRRRPISGRDCSRPRNMIMTLTLSPTLRNRSTWPFLVP